MAIASFGGPLALAALVAPGVVADAGASAGLAMVGAVVLFAGPIAIWLLYSREVSGAGGLYDFVAAAAGRRVALAQAAVWIFSYFLYLVYTTVQIVYDVLPGVLPGERRYQTLLALLIPVTIAAVMIAGRAAALAVIGMMAAGQLVLGGLLDGVTISHISTPASSFGLGAGAGAVAKAGAQTSLLYVCGSLPLFLGGELRRPERTIRRGLTGAYLVSAAIVVAAVAPLAAVPGLTNASVPGVTVVREFAGNGLANAIAIGVAVSIAGLILIEYMALTRLVHAIGGWGVRPVTLVVGVAMVLVAPFTLIDPEGFYNTLSQPSLVALWVSQLIVFAVYPRFAKRYGYGMLTAWALSLACSGLAIYALVTTLQSPGG